MITEMTDTIEALMRSVPLCCWMYCIRYPCDVWMMNVYIRRCFSCSLRPLTVCIDEDNLTFILIVNCTVTIYQLLEVY